ncbi:MAG TPA: cytochrome P450 [Nakamurella sp.]
MARGPAGLPADPVRAAALRDRRLGRGYEPDPRWPRWVDSERWSLLNLEPPDHTRLRRLVAAVFTPRAVTALRPVIEDYSDRTLSAARSLGEFDLIGDYAQPFSVAVICTLLGVPVADGPRLLDWSHAIVKMYEISTDDEHRAAAERAAGEFIDYVTALIAERRAAPRDDLISKLIGIADQGDRLTQDEIVCTVIVLLNAGHEATVNTLGNGMRALLRHPDQWARVATGSGDNAVDPAVDPQTAVEELIRWDGPLQLFERWVLDDGVEIAGQPLRVGERIAMLFGSANQDPARFDDADAFDVGRGDAGHIGFGGGTHFCIGAPLARLEIAVSLDRLRRDCPRIELAAEPKYEPFFVIRGLQELRVRW